MQVLLEADEAWSLMTAMTAFVIDHGGVSPDGKQLVRRWRTDRADGTALMTGLTAAMNGALGAHLDVRTTRQVKRKGRYITTKDIAR